MSLFSLREASQAQVPTPGAGRQTFFVDSATKQLFSKNSSGAFNPVGGFTDTFQLYPANHAPSGSISVYTLDLTGKPLPSVGKQINIKLSAPNTFGTLQISIPGLGTYNFFKVGGVNFAAGELKAGQVLSFIIDSGAAFYLSGFLQDGAISVADTAAMQALITSNSLSVGAIYQFAFTTKYTLNGVTVSAPTSENFLIRAIAPNAVESRATSLSYPLDLVEIDISATAPYNGKILRRKDPIKNLDAPFDWRNVKFRRGIDPTVASFYTVSNPADPAFSSTFRDVYCFGNSQSGAGCSNITIEGANFPTGNPLTAPFIPWGLDNLNIVITGGSNIHIKNSHSITVGGITGPNVSAMFNAMVIDNSWDCTFINTSSGYINGCRQVYAFGNISSTNDNYSIGRFSIRNSSTIVVLTSQAAQTFSLTEFEIENSNAIYLQSTSSDSRKIKISNSFGVWMSDCSRLEVIDVENSTFKSAIDGLYEHSSALTIVSSIQEKMVSSRSLVSMSVSGTILDGLKDVYQFRDKTCNVVAVTAGNPQTFVASIASASASFVNGDLVTVTNSVGLLNKATSIAFDTNADNIADTVSYPLVVGDFQRYYPASLASAAGNFYLLFNNSKFYLLFSALNCPFRIDTNNTLFDGQNSNITKTINFNAGAIVISDATNYDFGHVGILRISHVGANDLLSQINHLTGKYPNLKREIRNNNPGNIISLVHGIGSNLIAMPGASQRQINNALDSALIELDGNQWKVVRTSTLDDGNYSQRASIALTAAQLRNLNSLPILAAQAPGVNKMVRFLNAILVVKQQSIPFAFASNLSFKINNVVVSSVVPTAGATGVDSLGSRVLIFEPVPGSYDFSSFNNAALQFMCDANSVVGDSTATLIVNYRIVDLP